MPIKVWGEIIHLLRNFMVFGMLQFKHFTHRCPKTKSAISVYGLIKIRPRINNPAPCFYVGISLIIHSVTFTAVKVRAWASNHITLYDVKLNSDPHLNLNAGLVNFG